MGDVLTIDGSSWSMTGNPAMSGRVEYEGGKVQLIIEKVADQTREEAVRTAGVEGVAERLEELDRQLVFEVEKADGESVLKQVGKGKAFSELRFRQEG